jgi:alkylated DNA nucleotide flippase Atl1
MLCLAVERGVGLGEEFVKCLDRLNVRTVIDELPNGNPVPYFDRAAEMIGVPRGCRRLGLF